MADNAILAPQADLRLASASLHTAADEIEKLQNLPAIAGGEAILAAILQMRNDMMEQTARLEQRLTERFDQRFTEFERNISITMNVHNHNNTARVQNTYLANESTPLTPLLNPANGAVIDGFPATSGNIEQLRQTEINNVLRQLGLPSTGGSLEAKRKRLRSYIGLRAQVERTP